VPYILLGIPPGTGTLKGHQEGGEKEEKRPLKLHQNGGEKEENVAQTVYPERERGPSIPTRVPREVYTRLYSLV